MKKLLIFLIAISLFCGLTIAQQRTGNIYGTIIDEQGTKFPGVMVKISSGMIGTLTTFTNSNGQFRFLSLSPGKYSLVAELEGFTKITQKEVVISIGNNVTLKYTMSPKAIKEEITVVAAPIVLDVKKTTHSTNMTNDELQTMPSARDPYVIIQMAPGIVMDRENVGGSESGQQSSFTSHGSSRSDATWNMDGINVTDQVAAGAAPQYFNFDSFQEMQIQTAGADVTAMTPGVQINIVTKRGSNKLSGGGRFYITDKAFQGKNTPDDFNLDSYNPARINQIVDWGLNLGGAIFKDKLWGWIGYGANDISKSTLSSDNATEQNLDQIDAKLNAIFGSHRIEVAFNYNYKLVEGRVSNSDRDAWESHYNQTSPGWMLKIQDEITVGENLFLSLKGSHLAGGFKLAPIGPVNGVSYYDRENAAYSGTYRMTDYVRPQYFGGLSGNYYLNGFLGTNHEIKFGVEYKAFPRKRTRDYESLRLYYRDISDLSTGYRVRIYRDSNLNLFYDRYSFYLQDSFSLGKLNIVAGVRYDSQQGSGDEVYAPGSNFDWAGEYNFPDVNTKPQDLNFKWQNFSPRISMIYDIFGTGKTLLKANYATYIDHFNTGFAYSLASTYGYQNWNWKDDNQDMQVQGSEVTSTKPTTYRDYYNPVDPSEIYDDSLNAPLTTELTFGVEHELFKDVAISANLIYRKNTRALDSHYLVREDGGEYRLPTVDDWEIGGYMPEEFGGHAWWQYKDGIHEGSAEYWNQQEGYSNTYKGLEISFNKRLSAQSRWMLNGSLTLQDWTNKRDGWKSYGGQFDPTNLLPVDLEGGTPPDAMSPRWIAKFGFAVKLPYEILLGGTMTARDGFILNKTYSDFDIERNDLDDNPNVRIARYGTWRYPSVVQVNLSLDKVVKLGPTEIVIQATVFNLLNSNSTLGMNTNAARSNYEETTDFLSPRVFRLGFRFKFK